MDIFPDGRRYSSFSSSFGVCRPCVPAPTTTSPGNQETKFECVPRLFRTNEKRHGGQDYLRLALFSFFMNPFKYKRRARFFVYFGHGATHPRSNFPLSFLLFFIPNFSLENQPEKSCCCCCCLLRVVDLAPWLLIAPAWRLKGNFFLTHNLDDEM